MIFINYSAQKQGSIYAVCHSHLRGNNEVYASLGLTQEECVLIIENTIEKSKIVWQEEDDMEEGETPDALFPSDSPSGMLNHLIRWGWLKSDFDEKLNTCVISFPEYSQFVCRAV